MPAGVELRLWDGCDAAGLTAFLHRAYRDLADSGLQYVAASQTEEVTVRRTEGRECWLAVGPDGLVGTVTVAPPGVPHGCAWYERPDVAMFGMFAVEPALRGTGLGTALLRHAEERARALGAAELALDTADTADHLIAYYARRGYRLVDTLDWPATNFTSVVMSKRL
jgi:GNAT superfamily N-acetyltransferase